jgi:hypothetical protein
VRRVTTPDLVDVHLLELPVALAASVQEHFAELMREFALIASGSERDDPEHHVPARLTELIDTLVQQFGGTNNEADERLADAIDRGDETIADHVLHLPPEAGPASKALGDLIDEADEYCRRGQHLLTLATPPDRTAYRHWYLDQVVSQLRGEAPVPWPASEQAKSLRLRAV